MDILLVDDDPMLLNSLSNMLIAREHSCRTAPNGREALHRLEEACPDMVICDLQMPEMDGMSFLKHARAQFPQVPIVLMTAERNLDTAIAAIRSGIFDYLKKPIDPQDVMACIERINKIL